MPDTKANAQVYLPSSVEIKRVVMMYLLIGIMISLNQSHMSVFEYFHLKQALGWWMSFVVILIALIVLLLIPYVSVLALVILLAMLAIGLVYVRQALQGKYYASLDQTFMPVFVGVGGWIVDIFDLHIQTPDDQYIQSQANQNDTSK